MRSVQQCAGTVWGSNVQVGTYYWVRGAPNYVNYVVARTPRRGCGPILVGVRDT